MRSVLRLVAWAAVYVALLLLVPLAVPPTVDPSFTTPVLTPGDSWDYDVSTSYQGPHLSGGSANENVSAVRSVGPTLEATFLVAGKGPVGSAWPIPEWNLSVANGDWTSFSWTCPQGRSWANLSSPLPVGFSFPVLSPTTENATVPATLSGACAAGSGSVVSSGGAGRQFAPGGSDACTLYVCNQLRLYPFKAEVWVLPSGSTIPLVGWTLRGEWDPSVSGDRYLSVSPGLAPGFANRSVNLSLASTDAAADPPSPSPATMYGVSALLVLSVPLLAVLLEVLRFRRIARRAEEEEEAAVLAALPPEDRASIDDEGPLEDVTAPRSPG